MCCNPGIIAPILIGLDVEWNWGTVLVLAIVSAVVALRIWERAIRVRAHAWPVAQGVIDSASVQKSSSKRTRWVVRLNYSFAAFGMRYTGRYSRIFFYEDDAEECQRAFQGSSVLVHHSPRWPALSLMLDDDVDRLLQSRPPEAPPLPPEALQAVGVPWLKKLLAYPLMAFAAAGFVLSLYVHIASWFGRIVLPESWFLLLHLGIFVVFVPALLLMPQQSKRRHGQNQMPALLGKLMTVTLVYALANFALFMVTTATQHNHPTPAVEWRGFSGHWMVFYLWSFAFLYAGVHPKQPQPANPPSLN